MSSWLQVYNIDCRKVPAYEGDSIAAAGLIGSILKEGETMLIGSVVLGSVSRVVVENSTVRVYVKVDESIEVGSAYISGGN